MYEKLDNCPACKHPQFDNFMICQDHAVSMESFALVKCSNCELVFTNPRPGPEEIGRYYESENYISHTDRANSLLNLIYKLARRFSLSRKRKLIAKYSKSGTLLDYGCGTGDFLKEMQNNWEVLGVEPDESARSIASGKLQIDLKQNLTEIKNEKFCDVITAWHVVEHIHDLEQTMKQLRKKLVKGGHMFLAVPNLNSFDASHYQEDWAALDVPRHLYHFTEKSLLNLASQVKLKHIHTLPMKMDAYYVALLSEKYKKSKLSYLRALLVGLRSNSKAKKSGQYSSLIYVLQK